MRHRLITCLLLVVFCWGCSRQGSREEELTYLQGIMSQELAAWAHLDVADRSSVRLVSDQGRTYLGLHLSPGQRKLHGGRRSEVSVDYPFEPGDVVEYSWNLYFPEDFITDAPENRWWVVGQWHDQPDTSKGESWDNFPSRSPSINISLGELEDRLGLGLSYGPTRDKAPQQELPPVFLERGRWYRLTTLVRWSPEAEGAIQIFLDDNPIPVFQAAGANMNNGFQHYLKFGMYRHPDIATDNWIYVDDLTIRTTSWPETVPK